MQTVCYTLTITSAAKQFVIRDLEKCFLRNRKDIKNNSIEKLQEQHCYLHSFYKHRKRSTDWMRLWSSMWLESKRPLLGMEITLVLFINNWPLLTVSNPYTGRAASLQHPASSSRPGAWIEDRGTRGSCYWAVEGFWQPQHCKLPGKNEDSQKTLQASIGVMLCLCWDTVSPLLFPQGYDFRSTFQPVTVATYIFHSALIAVVPDFVFELLRVIYTFP